MSEDERLGTPVPGFVPPPDPGRLELAGRYARLEPLDARHGPALWRAFRGAPEVWDYMPVGPFGSEAELTEFVVAKSTSRDPLFLTVTDLDSGEIGGWASYLRIKPAAGCIEVGYIAFAPRLQRTRAATEAMYLMMAWAFEAGYRRYEWKCNALNRASRRAAQRLGLSYEGVFRQAQVVKGRNRDTAWLAATDADWTVLQAAFRTWLAPDNFDARGHQRQALGPLTAAGRVASDPLFGERPGRTGPGADGG